MRNAFLLAALLLLPAMPPAHADPGGGDAGETASSAVPLGPGTYSGTLGPHGVDTMDWYRVDHAVGQGVRVVMTGHSSVHPTLYSPGGEFLAGVSNRTALNATHVRWEKTGSGDGAVLIDLYVSGYSAVSYELEISFVPIADLSVEAVRVTPVPPLCTYDCPVMPRYARIEVELANLGELPYSGDLVVSAGSRLSFPDKFAFQHVALTPGSRVVLTYEWLGAAVGNVTFRATADPDPGSWNNERAVQHVILVDAPGVVAPLRP